MKVAVGILSLLSLGVSGGVVSAVRNVATVDAHGTVRSSDSVSSRVFIPAVKSYLAVQIPAKLHNINGEGHHLAHFGLTRTRGSMSRFVYLFDDDLCNPREILGGNTTYPTEEEHGKELVHPFFLMVRDVGGCTPVRMARVAQEFGASALILGERFCRCEDKECRDDFPADPTCYDVEPPLIDDGSASDVTIPTTLMHKKSFEALYKEFKINDQPVMMELTWGLPLDNDDIPDEANIHQVFEPHYHLWSTAHDPFMGAGHYRRLRSLAIAFGKTIHFSPKFYFLHGKTFRCPEHADRGSDESSPCNHLCTNHGLYCASSAGDVLGHDIVRETVRRLCIYKHYPAFMHEKVEKKKNKKQAANDDKINTAYWDYVIHHIEHCSDPTKYSDETCVEEAYKAANVDKVNIDGCMKDAGDIDSNSPNSLLDDMLETIRTNGVVEVPAMTLENHIQVDQPSAHIVFDAICKLFWEATVHSPYQDATAVHVEVPPICDTCGSCANIMGCVEAGHCVPFDHSGRHHSAPSGNSDGGDKKRGGYGWTITFLMLCVGGAGGAYYYYKKREEFVGDGGRALLDGYMQMSRS